MPTRGVAGGVGQGRRVPWLPIIALPLVLLATFLVLNSLLFVPTTDLRTQEALEGFDFSMGIGSIDRDLTDFWSGELYTPDDFAWPVGEPDYPASEDASTHDESRQGCRFERIGSCSTGLPARRSRSARTAPPTPSGCG